MCCRRPKLSAVCKEYTITAMMKLAARFPAQAAAIKNTIAQHASSVQLEVQSRSFEFTRLFNHESIRPQVRDEAVKLGRSRASADASLAFTSEQPSLHPRTTG